MKEIVGPILKWYEKNARSLPWRENINPYHIWISEIMLQQTKIEAVKRYYEKFIRELPTITDLANIDEEKLLKLWEGLGYYSRARNLKKAAQIMVEKYYGKMPVKYEELLKLPGIGEYTAGAIASIAFHEKIPAVDGNVLRVVTRVTGDSRDILLLETKKEVAKKLKEIMPDDSGSFNQGIMEIGETICIPNGDPFCSKCPLQNYCIAYRDELTNILPVRIKKIKRKIQEKSIFLIRYKNQFAIRKRATEGLLANMYEFPNIDQFLTKELIKNQLEKWNLDPIKIQEVGKCNHIFTHIEWDMLGYKIEVKEKNKEFIWKTAKEIEEEYSIPTAFGKWKEYLEDTLFDFMK